MADLNVNLWSSPEHALDYLGRADTIPHRSEGEGVLLDVLRRPLSRVLDLGSGDGRLLALVKWAHPAAASTAVDFSDTMIARLRQRFAADESVDILVHDLEHPLPELAPVDAVVSSFAIHHLTHTRKRALYEEVFRLLTPRGYFCNLEHVASPTPALHRQFLEALSIDPAGEDPSNKLLDVQTQLAWLRTIGFDDVDCLWKWRELALLVAVKPGETIVSEWRPH